MNYPYFDQTTKKQTKIKTLMSIHPKAYRSIVLVAVTKYSDLCWDLHLSLPEENKQNVKADQQINKHNK